MRRTPLLAAVVLFAAACERVPQDPLAPDAGGRASAKPAGQPTSPGTLDAELRAVRAASARFHSLKQAEKAGYTEASGCVSNPAGAAMGIHLTNPALRSDPTFDPLRPETMLYIPDEHGKLRLTGVEYFVWEADWQRANGPNAPFPVLFGQTFTRGTHGLPPHYELHVWLWAENPAGLFAPFNPTLSCPS